MPRTYHFMGWNRDRDAEQPCLIAPLEPIQFIDEARAVSPTVWDAMTDLMAFGTVVVVRVGPMFTLKDDDPQITWDDKAMAARPFRERKD